MVKVGILKNKRVVIGVAAVLVLAIIGGLVALSLKAATNSIGIEAETGARNANVKTVADTSASSGTFIQFSSYCIKGGVCTKADVAKHHTPTDCWVIYGTNVYNVTTYVSKHPGGSEHFPADLVCGNDVGPYLGGAKISGVGSHTHKSGAYTDLAAYLYATLQP